MQTQFSVGETVPAFKSLVNNANRTTRSAFDVLSRTGEKIKNMSDFPS